MKRDYTDKLTTAEKRREHPRPDAIGTGRIGLLEVLLDKNLRVAHETLNSLLIVSACAGPMADLPLPVLHGFSFNRKPAAGTGELKHGSASAGCQKETFYGAL